MIPNGSRILLDTVALIYFLEENSRYTKKAETIFGHIESGELQGIMANLVFAELVRLTQRLSESGIKVIAYKGPAMAHTLYGNNGKRHF